MSEPTVPTPGQVVGTTPESTPVPNQPVTTPVGAEKETPGQEGEKSEFLTHAEAARLKDEIISKAYSYADRGRDRALNAVKEVTNSVASLRGLGQAITPEQEKSLKDAAIQKVMTEPEPAPDGQAPQAEPQGQVDPSILDIQREKAIELFDNDPEVATLDRSHGAHKFYRSVEAACEAKKTRLAASAEPIQPISPSARVPGGGGGPSSPEHSGRDYLQEAHKQTSHT